MEKGCADWKVKITELKGQELLNCIQHLQREQIIEWLEWNDHNGVFNDEDSLGEFGKIMGKSEGELIMFCQISGISFIGEDVDYIKLYEEEFDLSR